MYVNSWRYICFSVHIFLFHALCPFYYTYIFLTFHRLSCPFRHPITKTHQVGDNVSLSRLISIRSVRVYFSMPSIFIMCSRNFNSLVLIMSITLLFVSIYIKPVYLFTNYLTANFCILLYNHIYVASSFFF